MDIREDNEERILMRTNKWYGWVKDCLDHRDKMYKVEASVIPEAKLPDAVDLRSNIIKVYNQGSLGSCTAQAIAGGISYIQNNFLASRLFIYYNERVIEETVREDSGAQIRDGIKTIAREGVCPEHMWKYIVSNFDIKPNKICYREAKKDVISSYLRITTLNQMKSCLAQGYPFVFGFSVYESFESEETAKTGIVCMPKDNDNLVGGHAVLGVGYDDKKKAIIVKNSWGKSWGEAGYFYMPYDYISNPNLASDFWTIRK